MPSSHVTSAGRKHDTSDDRAGDNNAIKRNLMARMLTLETVMEKLVAMLTAQSGEMRFY